MDVERSALISDHGETMLHEDLSSPKSVCSYPRIPPGSYHHKDRRDFKVAVSSIDYMIYESIHMNHKVKELCRRIETSWDVLYRKDDDDFAIEIERICCPHNNLLLDLDKKISFYFGDDQYHSEVMQDAILLLAEATTTILEEDQRRNLHDTENIDVSRAEVGMARPKSLCNSRIQPIMTPREQTCAARDEEGDIVPTSTAQLSDQRALTLLSFFASLCNAESKWSKRIVMLGRIVIIIFMFVYIFYIIWNPKLERFWSNYDNHYWGHIYHLVEGIYFLVMYSIAIRLFTLHHMQYIIERSSPTVVGLIHRWPEINSFVTNCAIGGVIVILLPAFVLIPDLIVHKCHEAFDHELKNLTIMTAPVEYTAYFAFSLINLPVFLNILMLVKIHITSIDSYKNWLIETTASFEIASAKFRHIQRLINDSSKALHWVLSFMFLSLLVWTSISMWYTVYRWQLEYKPNLYGDHLNATGCLVPPDAFRSTIIMGTQVVFFYIYPLYYISKIPQNIGLLLEEVHLHPCEEGLLIRDEHIKADIIGVLKSGLTIVPRFTVFRRIPISKLSTIILLAIVTPLLTIIWTTVVFARH